jgi:hypothetical protein
VSELKGLGLNVELVDAKKYIQDEKGDELEEDLDQV